MRRRDGGHLTDIREDVVKTPESGQTQHYYQVNKFICIVANHPGMAGMAGTVTIFLVVVQLDFAVSRNSNFESSKSCTYELV